MNIIFNALKYIDENYIDDAVESKQNLSTKRHIWIKAAYVAAILIFVGIVSVFLIKWRKNDNAENDEETGNGHAAILQADLTEDSEIGKYSYNHTYNHSYNHKYNEELSEIIVNYESEEERIYTNPFFNISGFKKMSKAEVLAYFDRTDLDLEDYLKDYREIDREAHGFLTRGKEDSDDYYVFDIDNFRFVNGEKAINVAMSKDCKESVMYDYFPKDDGHSPKHFSNINGLKCVITYFMADYTLYGKNTYRVEFIIDDVAYVILSDNLELEEVLDLVVYISAKK